MCSAQHKGSDIITRASCVCSAPDGSQKRGHTPLSRPICPQPEGLSGLIHRCTLRGNPEREQSSGPGPVHSAGQGQSRASGVRRHLGLAVPSQTPPRPRLRFPNPLPGPGLCVLVPRWPWMPPPSAELWLRVLEHRRCRHVPGSEKVALLTALGPAQGRGTRAAQQGPGGRARVARQL